MSGVMFFKDRKGFERPGAVIERLPEESRKILRELKSDDIKILRGDDPGVSDDDRTHRHKQLMKELEDFDKTLKD